MAAGTWLMSNANRNATRPAKRTADRKNGNTLNDKPAEGYTLRDADTGEIQKYGETTRGEDKFGAGKQRRYSGKTLQSTNSVYVKEASGTKIQMHRWQTQKIRQHKANNNGSRPLLNKSDY